MSARSWLLTTGTTHGLGDAPHGDGDARQGYRRDNDVGQPRLGAIEEGELPLEVAQYAEEHQEGAEANEETAEDTEGEVATNGLEGIEGFLLQVADQKVAQLGRVTLKREDTGERAPLRKFHVRILLNIA